jgi:hypothetical protein
MKVASPRKSADSRAHFAAVAGPGIVTFRAEVFRVPPEVDGWTRGIRELIAGSGPACQVPAGRPFGQRFWNSFEV